MNSAPPCQDYRQDRRKDQGTTTMRRHRVKTCFSTALIMAAAVNLSSCSGSGDKTAQASGPAVTVGVTQVMKKSLGRQITLESQLSMSRAKLGRDQSLFDYSKITAPFSGIVTERYANLGTLMQAGTGSSTQAIPLVKLSEDDLFRLVIPVPESYVHYIKVGDPVNVRVPSLNRTFPGKVARFSVDVRSDTRTMHTEVDVPNPQRVLVPGLYADAELELDQKVGIPTVPVQALNHGRDKTTVLVVNSDGALEERTVQVGMQTSADAEVISGVNEGEQVVISDRSGLKPGEKVHPQTVAVMEYQEGSAQ